YRQAICPERMQGRMNSVIRFLIWGTIPLGSILGGVLGSAIGLHTAIWIGAIGSTTTFLPVLLSSVRSIERMPEPEREEAVEAEAALETVTLFEPPEPVLEEPRA